MTTVQISFDELDKLHKDLEQKRKRIRFLEIISSANSKQADSCTTQQENLIQSLQSELETAKTTQIIEIDRLKGIIGTYALKEVESEKLYQDLREAQLEVLASYKSEICDLNTKIENLKEKAKDREQAHIKAINLYHNKLSQLKTAEFMDDRSEKIAVLEQEIKQLNAIINCRNLSGKITLIGDFKLTNINSNRSKDSIVLSGAYVVEKLKKIQGMAGNSMTIDDQIFDENRDYGLNSDDDIG